MDEMTMSIVNLALRLLDKEVWVLAIGGALELVEKMKRECKYHMTNELHIRACLGVSQDTGSEEKWQIN